jgi:fimbrial chaperone protein
VPQWLSFLGDDMKRYFSNSRKSAFFGIMLGLSAVAFPAMANLSITPTIVVIDGRERFGEVHLVNPTTETNAYEINWRFMRMEEKTGIYINQDKSVTEWDLTKHIVYTPRRVSIDPNTAQKVRLALRLGGEPPPPGDYRAHMEFMKVPDPVTSPVAKGEKKPTAKASVGVKVNVGFSIPVIYRVGESNATAKIGDVTTSLKNGKIVANIPVVKSKSPYGIEGNLVVSYQGKIVGQVKNANIFSEIETRVFEVPLSADKLSGGSLEVSYKDFDTKKDKVYDQKAVPISQ